MTRICRGSEFLPIEFEAPCIGSTKKTKMDGMKECLHQLSNFLEITSEELIQSLGDSAAFGTLKRLLKKADEVHRVEVRA